MCIEDRTRDPGCGPFCLGGETLSVTPYGVPAPPRGELFGICRQVTLFVKSPISEGAVERMRDWGSCLYNPPREKAIRENPRMRSNKSPSGAFKRQNGLRKQMEGLCPNKLRRFSRIANHNKIPLKMPKATRRAF